jgi:hypothetical protein
MASAYPQIDVTYYVRGRLIGPLSAVRVKVFDATNEVDLDDLESDANGVIAAGGLDVDPGTTIRFRVENHFGACGAWETVTTEIP